jgi:hypothetical protein
LVDGLPSYQDKLYDPEVFKSFEDILVCKIVFYTFLGAKKNKLTWNYDGEKKDESESE